MIVKNSSLKKTALLLAFVSSFGLSQAASAAAPCTDEINALKDALNSGICNRGKVCKGLSHKLDNANHKLEKGQYRHAARRLADFGAVVENLATKKKPRIGMDDYGELMGVYFNPAVACINNPEAVSSNDEGDNTGGAEDFGPEEEVY